MATPFNQGAPTIPVVLNTSNCFVFGNTASGNALSVQQLGTGNVATFRTTTGATALFVNAAGNVGVGTTNPQTTLQVSGPANTATNRTTPYANAFVSVTNDIFYGTTGQVGLEIGSGTRASGDNDRVYKYVLNTINNATVGAGVDFQILGVPTAPASYTSDGTARNRMTIRYDGNVGIGTSSPGLSLSVNGSVNLGAAYYTGNFNTKTGPFILQASGFDAVGTTHTIAYSSFQGSVNGDNLGGIMIIIGKNLSASGKAACMTLSIAKRAGAYTYVQTINNNAVGLSTFSVSISSNDIIITSDSDMAITWTFIAGV